MLPAELAETWRAEAAVLRKRSDERGALLLEQAAQELEDAIAAEQLSALSLQEAHELGGYSVDHLAREIREGRIPNAGKKGAPRILRRDVPVKPGKAVAPVRRPGPSSTAGARARRAARSL